MVTFLFNRLWAPASRHFANTIFNNHVQLYSIFPKTQLSWIYPLHVWLSTPSPLNNIKALTPMASSAALLNSCHPYMIHTTTTLGVQFHANATLSTIRKLSNTSLLTLCARNNAFSTNNSNCGQECDSCRHKDHIWSACYIHICPQAYVRRPHSFMMQAANSANDEQEQSGVVESAGSTSINHISSSSLQTDTSFNWNADSGATSHMTPHPYDLVDF